MTMHDQSSGRVESNVAFSPFSSTQSVEVCQRLSGSILELYLLDVEEAEADFADKRKRSGVLSFP